MTDGRMRTRHSVTPRTPERRERDHGAGGYSGTSRPQMLFDERRLRSRRYRPATMQYFGQDTDTVQLAVVNLVLVGHGVTLQPRHFVPQMRTSQRFAGHGVFLPN